MTRRRNTVTPLGETEIEVLHHVWDLGTATVADVQERILQSRKIAYTTIMTVMKKLSDKGYLSFEKEGATYVYSAARPPEEVQHGLLKGLLGKVFLDSPVALVQNLVRHENLSEEDREKIRRMIDSMEDEDE